MFEKVKSMLVRLFGEAQKDEPPPPRDEPDDRDAGILVSVRRGPPDRGSSVAVAEPDDDE